MACFFEENSSSLPFSFPFKALFWNPNPASTLTTFLPPEYISAVYLQHCRFKIHILSVVLAYFLSIARSAIDKDETLAVAESQTLFFQALCSHLRSHQVITWAPVALDTYFLYTTLIWSPPYCGDCPSRRPKFHSCTQCGRARFNASSVGMFMQSGPGRLCEVRYGGAWRISRRKVLSVKYLMKAWLLPWLRSEPVLSSYFITRSLSLTKVIVGV